MNRLEKIAAGTAMAGAVALAAYGGFETVSGLFNNLSSRNREDLKILSGMVGGLYTVIAGIAVSKNLISDSKKNLR